jgi:hypothetical protein
MNINWDKLVCVTEALLQYYGLPINLSALAALLSCLGPIVKLNKTS